jgi:hypothetical protein
MRHSILALAAFVASAYALPAAHGGSYGNSGDSYGGSYGDNNANANGSASVLYPV